MTLDEMIVETWDMLGKPTDITPLDRLDEPDSINPSLRGYRQLASWVNLGYKAITTWRTPGGQFFRHRDMIDRKYIQWGPHDIVGEHTETTDESELGYNPEEHIFNFPDDDFYRNNVPPELVIIGIKGLGAMLPYRDVDPESTELQEIDPSLEYWEVYQLLDADWISLAYFTDADTLYTLLPLPWVTDTSEITLYERGINWSRFNVINPLDDLYAIRQLRIIDKKSNMELASRTENFTQNLLEVGTPNEYFREGRYLYFDKHVDQEYTFQLEYYREAEDLIDGNDTPTIPSRYHTPIVYWATYRGLLRYGENKDAYSLKGFLDSEMRSIIKEDDMDIDRLEGNFIGGNN